MEAIKAKAGREYNYGILYVAGLYLDELKDNPNLSPNTIHYHEEVAKIFRENCKKKSRSNGLSSSRKVRLILDGNDETHNYF